MAGKNSLFHRESIVGVALWVKQNFTAGYCGRNWGSNMEVSVEGGPGCGEHVTHPYDAGRSGNGGNLSKGTRQMVTLKEILS